MTNTSTSSDCLNCGARLDGQYCGKCGQRSDLRLISLWDLLKEAFGDLFELDSRLWRTLLPLLGKPGLLTKDYLEGRRARYMPPFRTYLVLSIIFFVVAFFDPSQELGLLLEADPVELDQQSELVADSSEEVADSSELAADSSELAADSNEEVADRSELAADSVDDPDNSGFTIRVDDEGDCILGDDAWDDVPEWIAKRLTPERALEVCERIVADRGKNFGGLLLDNIPIALIVLMPLMALALKVLYPLSRRYFVEHLLFFVHFHAFFFLILILQILFAQLMQLLPIPGVIPVLAIVAASFYIPVYLYLAMHRVYGQRHVFTLLKYVVLLITYFFGASLTLLGAVVFALLSV